MKHSIMNMADTDRAAGRFTHTHTPGDVAMLHREVGKKQMVIKQAESNVSVKQLVKHAQAH